MVFLLAALTVQVVAQITAQVLLSTGWMDIHIELGQCRNCVEQISPSAGYSPTAPGYSPSSTGQYTPQLSNRDKDEDKNG
ncbi:hypothetical protein CKAN_02159300 [Cinnamomum micranthum f. kanehirae]|uniref:Secreted protein n=1 Tax=Cinnamomum micranthum f. kanehirae TaxID=337451 RepID=A0A3S3P3C7_9MAGN|nr:hypothetical protein CKAN_02159300 [Cinnamomum micranthum f. kanehirae]